MAMRDFEIAIRNPEDPEGTKVQATLPAYLATKAYKDDPIQFANLVAAKHVVENPVRIFYGVRQYNQGGWCYTGRPAQWDIREGVTVPFPPNLIYAVYLNPRLTIYAWTAHKVAGDDALSPEDWQNRYEGLTWKATF